MSVEVYPGIVVFGKRGVTMTGDLASYLPDESAELVRWVADSVYSLRLKTVINGYTCFPAVDRYSVETIADVIVQSNAHPYMRASFDTNGNLQFIVLHDGDS